MSAVLSPAPFWLTYFAFPAPAECVEAAIPTNDADDALAGAPYTLSLDLGFGSDESDSESEVDPSESDLAEDTSDLDLDSELEDLGGKCGKEKAKAKAKKDKEEEKARKKKEKKKEKKRDEKEAKEKETGKLSKKRKRADDETDNASKKARDAGSSRAPLLPVPYEPPPPPLTFDQQRAINIAANKAKLAEVNRAWHAKHLEMAGRMC